MYNHITKVRQKIGFLYRDNSCFPLHSKKKKRIVEAAIVPVLDYGDVIYGTAAASTLKQPDTVNHFALRFVTGNNYGTHKCVLYVRASLPPLTERHSKHWYMLIFKAIAGLLPPYTA